MSHNEWLRREIGAWRDDGKPIAQFTREAK